MHPTTPEPGKNKVHPLDKQPEVMSTPKGTDFIISQEASGLYYIKMFKAGGKVPPICEEKYTSHSLAKQALEGYIVGKS